jgi:hypothetical protein
MATHLSENLNELETVSLGSSRLLGYSLASTGVEHRFVAIKDGDTTKMMIVVPPGMERNISGLSEPFQNGINIESLTGDGSLVANIIYEDSAPEVIIDAN